MLGAHMANGLDPGSRKRGRPSKNRVVDPNAPCVPCPGKDGKGCVEAIKHGPDMIPYVYERSRNEKRPELSQPGPGRRHEKEEGGLLQCTYLLQSGQ